jgi:beta-lactamase regulating signal transducer with metallopeptidase domain
MTIQAISQVLAGMMVASAWQGILLAGLIWICVKFAPKTTANTRFLVWIGLFSALILLPLVAFLPHSAASAPHIPTGPVLSLDSRWALAIAAFWALFALKRAVDLVKSAFKIEELRRNSTRIEPDFALKTALNSGGGFRFVQLYASTEIEQPCVVGFLKPRILIPKWLINKATSDEIHQIVLHEVAHLRRFDDWTNLAQKLALILFPLNPALAWVERRLCAEREMACDESVVRATSAPHEYATCLANLAEQRMERRLRGRNAALSLGAWEGRSELAQRIQSILTGGQRLNPVAARALVAALILTTGVGAFKLGSSSQLVAFTDVRGAEARQASVGGHSPSFVPVASSQDQKARFEDAVFREPVASSKRIARSSGTSGQRLKKTPPARPALLPAKAPTAAMGAPGTAQFVQTSGLSRSATANVEGPAPTIPTMIPSMILVTRWNTPSGQRTTVTFIDSLVHISSLSAGESHTGWLVVQL